MTSHTDTSVETKRFVQYRLITALWINTIKGFGIEMEEGEFQREGQIQGLALG